MKIFSIWITGISGAGKTTLANNINALLNSNQYKSIVLDGDEIRKKMNKDLGFSIKDRDENIRRIACMSELLSLVVAIRKVVTYYYFRFSRKSKTL